MKNFLSKNLSVVYYPAVSGVLMALAFNIPFLWFLSFVGMVPYILFLCQKDLSLWRIFANSLLFGVIFLGTTISWFLSAHPLSWAGIDSKKVSLVLVYATWIFSTFFLSIFIALWGVVFYKIKNLCLGKTHIILIGSFLWLLFEYARAFAFSLLWAGSTSPIGAYWTLGFIGYALAESQIFIQAAGVGGIYLLNFIVIFVNLFITTISHRRTRIGQYFFGIVSGVLLVLVIISALYLRNSDGHNQSLRVALVTTDFPSFFKISDMEFQERITSLKKIVSSIRKSGENPDIIVFPEDSRFLSNITETERVLLVKNTFKEKGVLLIDSSRTRSGNGETRSTLTYFNTKDMSTSSYDKIFLMPNGEYLPFISSWIGILLGQKGWVKDFGSSREYGAGKEVLLPKEFRGAKIGALFCSEIIPNNLYRNLSSKDGANVLVNIASHSAFKGSQLLYDQTLKMAKVRAVENNRYFIQASNFAPSFIIDNRGVLRSELQNKNSSVLYGDVDIIKESSFYSMAGEWILFIALVFSAYPLARYGKILLS